MTWLAKLVRKSSNHTLVTDADVASAYRLLLGRDADRRDIQAHLEWAKKYNATPADLARRFLASEEYRASFGSKNDLIRVAMDEFSVFPRRGDRLIGAGIIQRADYEPYVVKWFEKSLSPGAYVLDVGANIGLYTFRAAARVGCEGRVIAVEPLPQNHRALYQGVMDNAFSNVWVLPFAASDRPGLIPAVCELDSSNGIVGVESAGLAERSYVPTCRLDDVLSHLPRLDVVKIDIEGHEPVAWRGMSALLQRHRPDIFSEFSPIAMRNIGNDAREYLACLFALGGRVNVLHRDVDPVQCADADAVMREWTMANDRAGLGGELHLDIHVQCRGESN